jgi:hypothetical protein
MCSEPGRAGSDSNGTEGGVAGVAHPSPHAPPGAS